MPDSHIPQPKRMIIRILRSVYYGFLIAAGVGGIVFTPRNLSGALGEPLTYWWAALLGVGSIFALIGAATHRYRFELLAVWPTLGGAATYTWSVWGAFLDGEPGRMAQACIVAALTISILMRALELGATAERLRQEHEARENLRNERRAQARGFRHE